MLLSIFQVCYYLCTSTIVDLFRWTSSVVKRWNGYLRSSKSMHSSRENPRNSSYLATWLYLGGWPACTPPTWWTRTRLWRRTTTTKKTHQNRVIHLDIELEKKLRYTNKKLICKNSVKATFSLIKFITWYVCSSTVYFTKYFLRES